MNVTPESVQANLTMRLNVRPAREDDEPFLRRLRAQADTERLLLDHVGLKQEEKNSLLQIQTAAFAKHYRDVNWEKIHCLIEINEEPAGAFITMEDKDEIRLADIVVDGRYRGIGVGLAIIQAVQNEAMKSKRPLRLHVEQLSPLRQFYQRMGFRLLEDRITHLFMEWLPPNLIGRSIYVPGAA